MNESKLLNVDHNKKMYDVIALLAGISLPFAFAPFSFYLIAIFSPMLLLLTWIQANPKRAFMRGLLYGLGAFGTGVSWVYISINTYGHANIFMAFLITVLFILYLALFPAFQGWLLSRYFSKNIAIKLLMAFPATWVLLEWIRSWLLSGFPWQLIGNSQINSPLRGLAPIFGVYGISFLAIFTSALITYLFLKKTKRAIISTLSIIAILWISTDLFANIHWTSPSRDPFEVSLIQGNIPQEIKWLPEQVQPTLSLYHTLTEHHWNSRLIVWPEAAITITSHQASPFLSKLDQTAKKYQSAIITGIPIITTDNKIYNSAIAIGTGEGTYHKRHLVPFGEYTPLKFIFSWFSHFVDIPMSEFSGGKTHQVGLLTQGIFIAPFICYEIAFPEEVRSFFPKSELMLTLNDTSWFGKSWASAQQLQISQMRALEVGRYLLFSSNSGITAIIDPHGKIQNALHPFQRAVLTGTITPMRGMTPWILWGSYPILGLMFLLLIIAFILSRKWERMSEEPSLLGLDPEGSTQILDNIAKSLKNKFIKH